MLRRLGASLSIPKGFAPSATPVSRATLGRALAFGLPVAALMAGLAGIAAGLAEPTLAGVVLEAQGDRVAFVDPGSLAWAEGIRPGQNVDVRIPGSAPDGWSLVTDDNGIEHGLSARAATATARLGVVPAAGACALGLLGIAWSARRRRRAELAGTVGLVLAWVPLAALHELMVGPVVGAIATVAPGLWLTRWTNPRAIIALWVAATFDVVCFAAAGLDLPVLPDIDSLRFDAAIISVLAAGALGVRLTPRAVARRSATVRTIDAISAVGLLTAVLVAQVVLTPPIWATSLVVVVSLLAYRQIRALIRSWLDRVLYAEQRERAGIAAAEDERARLSRELHDDPLQALAGVIIKLEDRPNTEGERETLRTVAGQLRNIATALHPPVLDDLGLVPAVESMFAESGPVPIELSIRNGSGFRAAERPPLEVELATYRIIQEAATNAIRHSGCQRIVVSGQVSPESVSIDVVDDGRGMVERELETALRGGHLGLASMRRRAEAIDAELVHSGRPGGGTTVSLRWSE
jgi:signal transduction histidine kinase